MDDMYDTRSVSSSQLPHQSALEFDHEKRRHRTTIRNSPRRSRSVEEHSRRQHPYEANQPIDPHYSHGRFADDVRLHKTDIRASPHRGDTRPRREPPQVTDLVNKQGPPFHTSHQMLSIEKSEHFTPILPVTGRRTGAPREGSFKHQSHTELGAEVKLCKTPLYPLTGPQSSSPHKGGSGAVGGDRHKVVDNYLNYSPHPQGYLHKSNKQLAKEKNGHLTALQISENMRTAGLSQRRIKTAAEELGLYSSNQTLKGFKSRHATDLHTSQHRSRSAQPERDLSPQYLSNQSFAQDKTKHRATHSCSPRRGGSKPDPQPKHDGYGYSSFNHFDADKRRHSVSPQPIRMSGRRNHS